MTASSLDAIGNTPLVPFAASCRRFARASW